MESGQRICISIVFILMQILCPDSIFYISASKCVDSSIYLSIQTDDGVESLLLCLSP